MTNQRIFRASLASSVLILPCFLAAFVSCADTDPGAASLEDASTVVVERDGGTDGDGGDGDGAPGPCDAGDPSCVTDAISCDVAAWCPVAAPIHASAVLTAVWGWSKTDVLAVGSRGTALRWDGATWTELSTPLEGAFTFFSVWGSGPNDIWVASGSDGLLHSTTLVNGAPQWELQPSLTNVEFTNPAIRAIWGSGPGDVRLGGDSFFVDGPTGFVAGNQFVRSVPGDEWKVVPSEGHGTLRGMWGSSATNVWFVADNGGQNPWERGMTVHGVGATADGLTWTKVDSQAAVELEAIWGSSADDVWAVGRLGTIRHTTDQAPRWSIVPSPTTAALHGIWGSSANDVWAVGDQGTILHYDGTTWTTSLAAFPVGVKPTLYGVWGAGPDDVWIVGDGVVLRFTGRQIVGGGS